MRRTTMALMALITACNGAVQEPAPTTLTVPEPAPTTAQPPTTTSDPSTTSTTGLATTTTTLPPLESLAYEEMVAVDFPIQMVPWGPGLELVATKDGQVWVYDGSGLPETPILDISGQVRNQGEQGLLSLAVHPEDTDRVFVHYSSNDGSTVVSELTWDGASLVDETVLLTLGQPARNHNGGMLQFGPDGHLYLGLGDGGGSNDRFDNAQNTDTLLGSLTRLDVDGGSDPVLWQYGLRNPWRFWIDSDLIYIADVGQNAFEEVNVGVPAEGVNYGWPITEGLHCFRPPSGCDTTGLTLPVIEVSHGDAGTCSITGGLVYRGEQIPEIGGHYFYSDYCGGYLRSFVYENGEVVEEVDWTAQVGVAGRVVSFGLDGEGEMYVLTTERILKVVPVRG
jgi:glucose/arabinose dehydrogenase